MTNMEVYREEFLLYDKICIGPNVPKGVGWYESFTELANSNRSLTFFNKRSESDVGLVYTNMKKAGQVDWPLMVESMGMEFWYPSPVNASSYDGDRAASLVFGNQFPKHAVTEFFIGGSDDKYLTLPPDFAPQGTGAISAMTGQSMGFCSTYSNGFPTPNNRWKWVLSSLPIPRLHNIELRLSWSEKGSDILKALHVVQQSAFEKAPNFQNWAVITTTLRCVRESQLKGKLFKTYQKQVADGE